MLHIEKVFHFTHQPIFKVSVCSLQQKTQENCQRNNPIILGKKHSFKQGLEHKINPPAAFCLFKKLGVQVLFARKRFEGAPLRVPGCSCCTVQGHECSCLGCSYPSVRGLECTFFSVAVSALSIHFNVHVKKLKEKLRQKLKVLIISIQSKKKM